MIFCGDGFSNPLKPTWGDVKYFKKSHFLVINGNRVKVLVNIISMVALVTRMNIQALKSYGVGVKAHYGDPFWGVTLYCFCKDVHVWMYLT